MSTPCDPDAWLQASRARIGAAGFVVTACGNGSRRGDHGLWFDLEGRHAWGRVTFWPDGKADLQTVDASTGECIFHWSGSPFGDRDLETWFEALKAANVA